MAEEISVDIGVPCGPLLRKIRDNKAQSTTRDAKQRAANVAGAYVLAAETDVIGKHILLIDDVVTTGSTLSEAARVLKKAGAKTVWAAALARSGD